MLTPIEWDFEVGYWANTTPRLYIGDNATTINGGLIGLGGPNSVTVDQIRGLGSTSPNGANFGSSGTANRVILLDANGVASLSQLNTQSTSGLPEGYTGKAYNNKTGLYQYYVKGVKQF